MKFMQQLASSMNYSLFFMYEARRPNGRLFPTALLGLNPPTT